MEGEEGGAMAVVMECVVGRGKLRRSWKGSVNGRGRTGEYLDRAGVQRPDGRHICFVIDRGMNEWTREGAKKILPTRILILSEMVEIMAHH